MLAEQEAEELERLKNAAPGLGDVLYSRIGMNKSNHGSKVTCVETYAALESLDKSESLNESKHGSGGGVAKVDVVDGNVDGELEDSTTPTPTITTNSSEDATNDTEEITTLAADDNDRELERSQSNQALLLQSIEKVEDELASGASTPVSKEEKEEEEAVKMEETAATTTLSNNNFDSGSEDEGYREFLRLVSSSDEIMEGAITVKQQEVPPTPKQESVENDIPETPLSPEDISHIGTITIED